MKHFLAALFALCVLAPAAALADVIHLRDGSVLHGRVVSRDNGVVVIETQSSGTIRVNESEVSRIEDSAPTPPPPPPTPWPTATPPRYESQPPPPPPPSRRYWEPRRHRSNWGAGYDNDGPVWLEMKLGGHSYSGKGWNNFGDEQARLSGPAFEGTMRLMLQGAPGIRFDGVGTFGVYGGSDDCFDTVIAPCSQLSLTNVYAESGMRLTFDADPFFVYGQAGGGVIGSTMTLRYDPVTSDSESHASLAGHVLGGVGMKLEPFDVFGELKYVASTTHFDLVDRDLGMGGVVFTVGAGVHF